MDFAVTDSNFRFAAYVDEVVKVRFLGVSTSYGRIRYLLAPQSISNDKERAMAPEVGKLAV